MFRERVETNRSYTSHPADTYQANYANIPLRAIPSGRLPSRRSRSHRHVYVRSSPHSWPIAHQSRTLSPGSSRPALTGDLQPLPAPQRRRAHSSVPISRPFITASGTARHQPPARRRRRHRAFLVPQSPDRRARDSGALLSIAAAPQSSQACRDRRRHAPHLSPRRATQRSGACPVAVIRPADHQRSGRARRGRSVRRCHHRRAP